MKEEEGVCAVPQLATDGGQVGVEWSGAERGGRWKVEGGRLRSANV
jgi:hypothetical protein